MRKRISALVLKCSLLGLSFSASAELASLSDDELSSVDGAGIGLVFEDFVFDHGDDQSSGQTFKINGIKSTQGEDVEITVSQLYIARSGSNYGENLNPVNLGRLNNPFEIDLIDGNTLTNSNANTAVANKAIMQFAAPTKVDASVGYDCLSTSAVAGSGTCSSRPADDSAGFSGERPDFGLKLQVAVGSKDSHNLNLHAKSAVFDGSYLRLWGDDDRKQMVGEYRLNFYTPELSINTCDPTGQNCGSTIYMRNFELELALGNRFQPMYMSVTETQDGDIAPGNFVYEIKAISHQYMSQLPANGKCDASNPCSSTAQQAYDFFKNYYENDEFRSNLRIGALEIGDINASGKNFGSAKIEGMLIQYLKISSHDLN